MPVVFFAQGPILLTEQPSSGSEAGGLLGVGTPNGSSALGLGDDALSAGAGVMGSSLATSNISRSIRLHLSQVEG